MEEFNPFSLKGKKILVTGASSGIGQSIAISCSRMGAEVWITGRNKEKLASTKEMMDGLPVILRADLTVESEIEELVEKLPDLDGIVHCAGIGHNMPTKFIGRSDLDLVMNANFTSSVLLQTALLQNKKICKGASIVFIASRAANCPTPGNAVYSASKGALISYSKCLAIELAPRKIRVNCICPAMVWTSLIRQNNVTEDQLRQAEQQYPLKRFGQPEDIANLAIYLLSNASCWMTNTCIDITGGSNTI